MLRNWSLGGFAGVIGACGAMGAVCPAAAQATQTVNYACTGGTQTVTAPVDAASARVTLAGAAGEPAGSGAGGDGESLTFVLPVSSQQQFTLDVGCRGAGGSGGGSGGDGGGASYLAPQGGGLSDADAVAGGGGGAGGDGATVNGGTAAPGGAGGAAGEPGGAGLPGQPGTASHDSSGTEEGGQPGAMNEPTGPPAAGGAGGAGVADDGQSGSAAADGIPGSGGPSPYAGSDGGGGGGGFTAGGGGGAGGLGDFAPGPIWNGGGGAGGTGGTSYLAAQASEVSSSADVTGDGSATIVWTVVGDVLPANGTSGDLGDVAVGGESTRTLTYTYSSGLDPVTVGQASLQQTGGVYSIIQDSCSGTQLASGATCSVTVGVAPNAVGADAATLTLPSDASNGSTQVDLTANAVQPDVTMRPGSGAFPSVAVGGTQTRTFVVSDTGTATVDIAQATVTGSPSFTLVTDQDFCSDWTVIPGSTCAIEVAFTPTSTAPQTATLTVPSNAGNSPQLVQTLSGAGTPAAGQTSPGAVSGPPFTDVHLSTRRLPSSSRAGSGRLVLHFTLAQAGTVGVTLQRETRGHWRTFAAERSSHAAGPASVRLDRRLRGRDLRPGRYRVQLRSIGADAAPVSRGFTIAGRRRPA